MDATATYTETPSPALPPGGVASFTYTVTPPGGTAAAPVTVTIAATGTPVTFPLDASVTATYGFTDATGIAWLPSAPVTFVVPGVTPQGTSVFATFNPATP